MGVLAWLVIGVVMGLGVRFAARRFAWRRGWPPLAPGIVGAVVGGFIADLAARGDSVSDFRGPSVIGAAIGAALLIGTMYAIGWTATDEQQMASRS